jgi:hypothetical protein
MKNVAKCDTWCELQNPVNHRVFERKLRPKPLGRGHVCLGVTHRVSLPHIVWDGEEDGLPCLTGNGWPKKGAPGYKLQRHLVEDKALPSMHPRRSARRPWTRRTLTCCPLTATNLCDPRSGGATR